jgi:hypothetical protein
MKFEKNKELSLICTFFRFNGNDFIKTKTVLIVFKRVKQWDINHRYVLTV